MTTTCFNNPPETKFFLIFIDITDVNTQERRVQLKLAEEFDLIIITAFDAFLSIRTGHCS